MKQPTGEQLAWMAQSLKAMSTPVCLAILLELEQGEATVTHLMALTGLSQSALSHKLARMRHCRLVLARPAWPNMFYRLRSPDVALIVRLAAVLLHQEADHL